MNEMLVQSESNVMPVNIRRAVGVLWLSLLLGLVAQLLDWRHVYGKDPIFAVAIQIFTYGYLALLIWKMSEGRNWARITWLILFVCGCLLNPLFAVFSKTFRAEVFGSLFSVVVIVVQTAVQFYATVLLFTSRGRAWFVRNQ